MLFCGANGMRATTVVVTQRDFLNIHGGWGWGRRGEGRGGVGIIFILKT